MTPAATTFVLFCVLTLFSFVCSLAVPKNAVTADIPVALSCLKGRRPQFRRCFSDAESASQAEQCVENLSEKMRMCYNRKMRNVSRGILMNSTNVDREELTGSERQNTCDWACNGGCVGAYAACLVGCLAAGPFYPLCAIGCSAALTICRTGCELC